MVGLSLEAYQAVYECCGTRAPLVKRGLLVLFQTSHFEVLVLAMTEELQVLLAVAEVALRCYQYAY